VQPVATYRDAVVADALGIARVSAAAWQAVYHGLMPSAYLAGLAAETAVAAFEQSLRESLSAMVIEAGGEIIGFAAYGASRDADATPVTGEVIAINLHPSWWRRGLGAELLRLTLQRLAGRGFSDVTLWVIEGNVAARRFYEAQGWTWDGLEKRDDRLTGFELHEVRYRRAASKADL